MICSRYNGVGDSEDGTVTSFCGKRHYKAGRGRHQARAGASAARYAGSRSVVWCDDVHGCVLGLFRCHSVNGLELDAHTRVVDATESCHRNYPGDSLNNNITRTLTQDLSIVEPIIIIMGRRHRSFAR